MGGKGEREKVKADVPVIHLKQTLLQTSYGWHIYLTGVHPRGAEISILDNYAFIKLSDANIRMQTIDDVLTGLKRKGIFLVAPSDDK